MNSEASEDQQTQSNGTNVDSASQGNQASATANYKFMKRKVFNDPIHGHIELHPVCVRIIDTPQFQRLRHIKQLDACYLVYPGASHNRFEHSLGTCYLAGKLMRTLKKRQPQENITERDILCVEIAALCHDLGQGPFSHVFEKKFMPQMRKTGDAEFTHEETAKRMFRYMLLDGKLKQDIQKIIRDCRDPSFEQFDEDDFLFIEEMIDKPKDIEGENWPYRGRDESKSFMYEIVANKRNGIDVDKWDYLARDSYMLGMKVNFDHRRCFMSARVIKTNGFYETNGTNGRTESNNDNGNNETPGTNGNNGENASRNVTVARKQICYREKDAQDFYDMFYTRITLHRRAYKHKTHNIIGMMICDALIAANHTVKFIGIDGKKYSDIETSSASNPAPSQNNNEGNSANNDGGNITRFIEAKKILNNILKRNLYKCVLQTQVKLEKFDEQSFKEKVIKPLHPVPENQFVLDVVRFDYGMKDKDPMSKVRFYRKEKCDTPIKLKRNQVSYVLPDTFAEYVVRIYFKERESDTDEGIKQLISNLRREFNKWCSDEENPLPKGSSHQSQHANAAQRLTITERDTQQASRSESGISLISEQEPIKQIPGAIVPGADENTEQTGPPFDVTENTLLYIRQSKD